MEKKLSLTKETLRRLEDGVLKNVKGGGRPTATARECHRSVDPGDSILI